MAHWSIGKQLGLSFLFFILFIFGFGTFTVVTMRDAATAVAGISEAYLPESALAGAFEREILNARISFIYHVTIQKPGALETGWKRFSKAEELMPQLIAKVDSTPRLVMLREPTARLASDLARYKVLLGEMLEVVKNGNNKGPEFAAMIKQWAALGGSLATSAGELNHKATEMSTLASHDYSASLATNVWVVLAICAVGGSIGLFAGLFVVRRIRTKLTCTAVQLSQSARAIATSSAQLASASTRLARSATEQASSLRQTSASCQEVSTTAHRNTEDAQTMAASVAASQLYSQQTNETLQHMKEAMAEISNSGGKVSEIIKIIDGIAFQTNLLGLNAAVEAARAGAHGTGFAVVADEVRSLAQRSAKAARDTTHFIENSKTKTQAGELQMERAVDRMKEIIDESTRAKSLADQVSQASREQMHGMKQIAHAIAQLERLTQQWAASADNSGRAASNLSNHSGDMERISSDLLALVGGSNRPE